MSTLCTPAPSDAALVDRYVRGRDHAAFTELTRRLGPLVWSLAVRNTRHREDAEDVLQLVFAELARRAGTIAEPAAVAGWLHTLTVRTASAVRSRRTPRPGLPYEPVDASSLDAVGGQAELDALSEELDRLPTAWREPLLLRYFNGLTNEEAADRLGTTITALEGRLKRGKNTLRVRLLKRGVGVAGVLAAVSKSVSTAAAAGPETAWPELADAATTLAADAEPVMTLATPASTAATTSAHRAVLVSTAAAAVLLSLSGGGPARPVDVFDTQVVASATAQDDPEEDADTAVTLSPLAPEETEGDEAGAAPPAGFPYFAAYNVDRLPAEDADRFRQRAVELGADLVPVPNTSSVGLKATTAVHQPLSKLFNELAEPTAEDERRASWMRWPVPTVVEDTIVFDESELRRMTAALNKELGRDVFRVEGVDLSFGVDKTTGDLTVPHVAVSYAPSGAGDGDGFAMSRLQPLQYVQMREAAERLAAEGESDLATYYRVEAEKLRRGGAGVPRTSWVQEWFDRQPPLADVTTASPVRNEMHGLLDRPASLNVDGISLKSALKLLASSVRAGFQVDSAAEDAAANPVTANVNGTFGEALDFLITRRSVGLDYDLRDGTITLTTTDAAARKLRTEIYDIPESLDPAVAVSVVESHASSDRGPVFWTATTGLDGELIPGGSMHDIDSGKRLLVTQSDRGHEAIRDLLDKLATNSEVGDDVEREVVDPPTASATVAGSTLVIYEAAWCRPCQQLRESVEEVRRRSATGFRVQFVDIDGPLGKPDDLDRIPASTVIERGKEGERRIGMMSPDELEMWLRTQQPSWFGQRQVRGTDNE